MKKSIKIAISITLGLAVLNYLQRKNDNPKILYLNKLPYNHNAFSVPGVGIFIKKSHRNNKMLLAHELVHWKQYQREGFINFITNYRSQHKKVGYDLNPYEIEARVLSGEKEECIKNYTNCVRSGNAKTVYNKNFRNPIT
jgi:hypothetical protein